MTTAADPVRRAAENLFIRLADNADDVLHEACADTWPAGVDAWYEQAMPASEAEAHSESTYRQIMVELGAAITRRAGGGKPWPSADQAGGGP